MRLGVDGGLREKHREITPYLLLSLIVITDFCVRLFGALNNNNFAAGDALAPYSVLDALQHGEIADYSRQQWLLPWLLSVLSRAAGFTNDFYASFHMAGAVTALFTTACLPLTYYLARNFCGRYEALVPVLLLSFNTSYFLSSISFNPTQVYGFFFLAWGICISGCNRPGNPAFVTAAVFAVLATLVRWEGGLIMVLTLMYAVFQMVRTPEQRLNASVGIAIIILGSLLSVSVHIFFSSAPFAFLINTGARLPVGGIVDLSFVQILQVITGSLGWKFEKLHAVSINITLIGLCLAVVGACLKARHMKILLWVAIYWFCYEIIMFVYTIISPIGNINKQQFLTKILVKPVHRYYQIFSPILLILSSLGGKSIVSSIEVKEIKYLFGGVFLAGYFFFELMTGINTFQSTYARYPAAPIARDAVSMALQLRQLGIRRLDVAIVGRREGKLAYDDRIAVVHPMLLAIISGMNRVNCSGWNLSNPNLYCSTLAPGKTLNLLENPLGARTDALILAVSSPRECVVPDFSLSKRNKNFCLLLRKEK